MTGPDHPLYLASRSPRRRELLDQIGLSYCLLDVEVDESHEPDEPAETYVVRVAGDKARTAFRALGRIDARVLAADTAVVLDGTPLGKPTDETHALAMLESLSGRTHRVLTGVALATRDGTVTALSESHVRIRETTPAERAAYVATGEPMDKAGGYAIQGRAAVFIEHLDGSYSGVMGLPVFETAALLQRVAIDVASPGQDVQGGSAEQP